MARLFYAGIEGLSLPVLALAIGTWLCGCGGDDSSSRSHESQEVKSARHARDVASEMFESTKSLSDQELFEDVLVSIGATNHHPDPDHIIYLSGLHRSIVSQTYNKLLKNKHALTKFYTAVRAANFIGPFEEFEYSEDKTASDYEYETLNFLYLIVSEFNERIFQSMHLYDPEFPSLEAVFPFLVESGPYRFLQPNTLFYYFLFRRQELEPALEDAEHVLSEFETTGLAPQTDSLNDPGFWAQYLEHGGTAQGVRVLRDMLATREIRPPSTPEVFELIQSQGLGYSASENLARWRENLEKIFTTPVGSDVVVWLSPGDYSQFSPGPVLVTIRSFVVAGVTQAVNVDLYGEGSMYIYRQNDLLFGRKLWLERWYGPQLFEFHGEKGFHMTMFAYDQLRQEISGE